MTRKSGHFLILLGVLLLLCRCAQVGVLTGGPKDTTPPKLLAAMPPPQHVNFKEKKIELEFDEYVQLVDLPNQLIISPQMKEQPVITSRGKSVSIDFSDIQLLPNTTYRFNFGRAIADMNESNSMDGFEYVFATGPAIDTLELTGRIVQANDNSSMEDVQVGLYTNKDRADSIPYKYEPQYLSKTDRDGRFTFRNLPSKNFRLYAITDKNKNLLYDGDLEQLAFLNEELVLNKDSVLSLSAFREIPSKTFIRKTTSPFYGLSQVIMNKPCSPILKPLNSKDENLIWQEKKSYFSDTVSFFYQNLSDTLALQYENADEKKTDSVFIRISSRPQDRKNPPSFQIRLSPLPPKSKDTLLLNFSTWMDTSKLNLSRCRIISREDTLSRDQQLSAHWLNIHVLAIFGTLKEGTNYQLITDTGAFRTVHGIGNDSLSQNFKTRSTTEFGKATLHFKLLAKQNYLIQLLAENNMVVAARQIKFSLSSSNAAKLDFTGLLPGTYLVKIIFDDNGNGKWDTGNLNRQEQAERVIISSKQIKVVSDWEIEEEIPER